MFSNWEPGFLTSYRPMPAYGVAGTANLSLPKALGT